MDILQLLTGGAATSVVVYVGKQVVDIELKKRADRKKAAEERLARMDAHIRDCEGKTAQEVVEFRATVETKIDSLKENQEFLRENQNQIQGEVSNLSQQLTRHFENESAKYTKLDGKIDELLRRKER